MKKGLILEGGAMRGMFTAGVTDVMMEHGIRYDGAVGVSAGAAFGCNYKSGQIGRAIRYNMRFCNDRRYCGWGCLLRTGNIYSEDFAYGEVPRILDPFDFDAYVNNPMSFYIVCTDIETGQPVYHLYKGTEPSGFDWIRASASMPLVSRHVEIEGRKLLDGGITDAIPLRYFETLGYTKMVLVLTQPKGYRKMKTRALPLLRLMYRQYPKLVEAMAHRHIMYNNAIDYIAQQEAAGNIFVLRPESPLPVSRMERNPLKLKLAYDAGRHMAAQRMEELQGFLKE